MTKIVREKVDEWDRKDKRFAEERKAWVSGNCN